MEIVFTNDYNEACRLRDQGFEPIECAFGSYGSVLGELAMDHHGTESWREGVAIRACRDHYGARQGDPRFVVTGNADADATLAIIALAALVPQGQIPQEFYELVDLTDTTIGHDLSTHGASGAQLLAFKQQRTLPSEEGFRTAIAKMTELLTQGLSPAKEAEILAKEADRVRMADATPIEKVGPQVGFVSPSPVWGWDRWYRTAPCCVTITPQGSISIGCPSKEAAEKLFGPGGLLKVFPLLGEGWGGREAIGGSPRGTRFTLDEARTVAAQIADLVLPR